VSAPGGQEAQPERLSYEAATARVEEIIRRLDSGEASLDETLALVGEGKRLIEQCAGELAAVGAALEELKLDELVARLEREAAGG
jgi:exodeoxyribonuclease VII small subunit